MRNLWKNQRLLTSVLTFLGAGIILIYATCGDTCLYLKGSIWGIDLKYLGLIFLALIFLLNLFKKDILCLVLLSLGLGGEVFLIGYQIVNATYCPYCLAFGAVLIIMFAINFNKTKLPLIFLALFLGLAFFFFSFSGATHPAFAEDNFITSFGAGPASIRIYSDYFCGPCRAAEHEVETLLSELMQKNAIGVTFIDTPIHSETALYAKYFLYILNEQHSFPNALLARRALYEAAAQKLIIPATLEAFLAKKNVKFRTFNVRPIFNVLTNFIKEDNIRSTPTCVIITPKGKEKFVGRKDIIEGLKALRKTGGNIAAL